MYYSDEESLVTLLTSFDRDRARAGSWNAYRAFEPARVMQSFKRIFLQGGHSQTALGSGAGVVQ